ncbi:MAG TPA: ERF family protein [Paenisporosarcina sp.]|nr:ERF family protein [Paenisporosarcina sp.]
MNKSETIGALAKALSTFQGEVKQPLKDKDNPFFKSKYVPLENVVEAITEISAKHGLSFLQYPVNQENKVGIITILMHSSGEFIETEPIYATPTKQDAQAAGSVITYLKRYSLSAVFGITSDEDDDGNNGSGNSKPKQPYNAPKPNQSKPPEAPLQDGPKMISDAQVKLLKTKLGNVSKNTGTDKEQVYKSVQDHLNIHKATKELTSSDASKVINHLMTLE